MKQAKPTPQDLAEDLKELDQQLDEAVQTAYASAVRKLKQVQHTRGGADIAAELRRNYSRGRK